MKNRTLCVLILWLTLAPSLVAQTPSGSLRAESGSLLARAALVGSVTGAIPTVHGESAAVVARGQRRQGVVLMLVGAAGIVTGIIVDESIVTIAGAGVAGFGLYLYLDSGGKVGMRVPLP